MLRYSGDSPELAVALQEALDTMLSVLAYLNDSMHQVSITGYSVSNLGVSFVIVMIYHINTTKNCPHCLVHIIYPLSSQAMIS